MDCFKIHLDFGHAGKFRKRWVNLDITPEVRFPRKDRDYEHLG
jgi:hypothetical protein